MTITHVTPFLSKSKGGPSVSVPALAKQCALLGAQVNLVSQTWQDESFIRTTFAEFSTIQVETHDKSGWGYSSDLLRVINNLSNDSDIIHNHGLWMHINQVAMSVPRERKKPYVITPRGMLEPYILARSQFKKSLVSRLWQNKNLTSASCIHALCVPEAESIRNYGLKNPIAVIPNGVDLDNFANLPPKNALSLRWKSLESRRIILSLSRIHPKKGLMNLIKAWNNIYREFTDWHLVIAGPDELGHRAEVEQVVSSYNLSNHVTFLGPVVGVDKLSALASADIFALPSFSEGFSMAILEAMACSLPVLLTPGCNFPEAVQNRCAVEVRPDHLDIERGLRILMELSDAQRREIGVNGRRLVESRYTWHEVGVQMLQVYEWCLGGGSPPASIQLD